MHFVSLFDLFFDVPLSIFSTSDSSILHFFLHIRSSFYSFAVFLTQMSLPTYFGWTGFSGSIRSLTGLRISKSVTRPKNRPGSLNPSDPPFQRGTVFDTITENTKILVQAAQMQEEVEECIISSLTETWSETWSPRFRSAPKNRTKNVKNHSGTWYLPHSLWEEEERV